MKLEWSMFALSDRDKIFDYIEADNPRAAVTVDDLIKAHVEQLIGFPLSGRSGRVDGTRELVVSGTPYIAVYRIADGAIRILRVLHGARPWPEEM
ncbi:type II toxin-antitoxin system RelE/ParE family toxin [Telmatospirillum sp.]|uniref:type II toxin-antitoxin system RelE/ParE family toxin n=1 Tax=Telmatospirillum sp. TaxID=2079197 RepID=UPI00284CE0A5|nr:type II toxin-antitoxin system RelE/ParE family toxin [Telmatospirillum sp.]MDR3439566.1 type II toxin-antitoxin system RelE/ParE family toxin [Telmatospirillum sp.]